MSNIYRKCIRNICLQFKFVSILFWWISFVIIVQREKPYENVKFRFDIWIDCTSTTVIRKLGKYCSVRYYLLFEIVSTICIANLQLLDKIIWCWYLKNVPALDVIVITRQTAQTVPPKRNVANQEEFFFLLVMWRPIVRETLR